MQKQFYFLSPVEVVKVTAQNLEEAAAWCGGQVAQTDSRRRPGTMDSYVWVPTPKSAEKGGGISWAFPGMFITKRLVRTIKDELRVTYAVFRKDYFEKNYFDTPIAAVEATWEKAAKKQKKETTRTEMVQMQAEELKELLKAETPRPVVINVFNNAPEEPKPVETEPVPQGESPVEAAEAVPTQ
jgi:hypothetical protein